VTDRAYTSVPSVAGGYPDDRGGMTMDDLTMATTPWTGTERRLSERRMAGYEFGGTERRFGSDRRSPIALAAPSDPALALSDPVTLGDRDMTHASGGVRHEHDAIPSVAALGGHPLHPLLVPLPIGSFVLTLAADAAYAMTHDRFFARAATALTAVGIGSGLLAATAGAADFLGRERIRDHRAAWLHAAGNVSAVGLSAASLALRLRRPGSVPPAAMAASVAVGGLMLVTGWLGGEMAYRHRIGVTKDRGFGV
jgi:uncharacterized membrane protein